MHLFTHPIEVWTYLKGWLSYVSYQGVYTHTMVIFSFCNVDDVSWGTKGATDNSGEKKFATKKMYFVSRWLFWNTLLCFILFLLEFILHQDAFITNFYVLLVLALYSTI
jgi:chitin synthase